MAWELVKLESKKISNKNLNELYGIVENLMGILMEMEHPFYWDSDLMCGINVFDDCVCPMCESEDQDDC